MKKKVVSLLLAAAMTTAALAGCGSSNGSSSSDASTGADSTSATSASASTDGEKKDAAGEKIAMITDSGDITDESFNQITWETVCAYGDANGVEYEYYKPAEDTDEERINSIEASHQTRIIFGTACEDLNHLLNSEYIRMQYPDHVKVYEATSPDTQRCLAFRCIKHLP